MSISAFWTDTAPRRRLTMADAPTCACCGRRYLARNSYPTHTRYQRACVCPVSVFSRIVVRPIDLSKLDRIDRVRLGLS